MILIEKDSEMVNFLSSSHPYQQLDISQFEIYHRIENITINYRKFSEKLSNDYHKFSAKNKQRLSNDYQNLASVN